MFCLCLVPLLLRQQPFVDTATLNKAWHWTFDIPEAFTHPEFQDNTSCPLLHSLAASRSAVRRVVVNEIPLRLVALHAFRESCYKYFIAQKIWFVDVISVCVYCCHRQFNAYTSFLLCVFLNLVKNWTEGYFLSFCSKEFIIENTCGNNPFPEHYTVSLEYATVPAFVRKKKKSFLHVVYFRCFYPIHWRGVSTFVS